MDTVGEGTAVFVAVGVMEGVRVGGIGVSVGGIVPIGVNVGGTLAIMVGGETSWVGNTAGVKDGIKVG